MVRGGAGGGALTAAAAEGVSCEDTREFPGSECQLFDTRHHAIVILVNLYV